MENPDERLRKLKTAVPGGWDRLTGPDKMKWIHPYLQAATGAVKLQRRQDAGDPRLGRMIRWRDRLNQEFESLKDAELARWQRKAGQAFRSAMVKSATSRGGGGGGGGGGGTAAGGRRRRRRRNSKRSKSRKSQRRRVRHRSQRRNRH